MANLKKLTSLLSLATASARTGNVEDSHDIFDLFMHEIITAEAEEERSLADAINTVIASVLTDANTDLTDDAEDVAPVAAAPAEVVAASDDDGDIEEDLASGNWFGGDHDFADEEDATADVDPVIANSVNADVIAANLRALRGE